MLPVRWEVSFLKVLQSENLTREYRDRAAGATGAAVAAMAEGPWQRGEVRVPVKGQASALAEVMLTQQKLPVEAMRSHPSSKGKEGTQETFSQRPT